MIDRRRFLLTSLAAAVATPLGAAAQPAAKVYRIGMLETRSASLNGANVDAFRKGMAELGYKDGQNLQLIYRSSNGYDAQFPDLAAELIRLNVDLILTRGTPAVLAAMRASRTTPVVMAATGDPVGAGLVASLARPGGNVTGLTSRLTETYAKRVQLMNELLPRLARLAGIFNMGNRAAVPQWHIVEATARSLKIKPQLLDVRRPDDLPRLFETARKERAEALIVGLDGVTQGNLGPIAEFALKDRLPSIYPEKAYAEMGGTLSYGVSDYDMYHRAATFVDKILNGAKPADLPIEQPPRFELVINLKTAKALALTIPPSLLARADQVIE
jgi:putative ABC transport system substrate-binding protein